MFICNFEDVYAQALDFLHFYLFSLSIYPLYTWQDGDQFAEFEADDEYADEQEFGDEEAEEAGPSYGVMEQHFEKLSARVEDIYLALDECLDQLQNTMHHIFESISGCLTTFESHQTPQTSSPPPPPPHEQTGSYILFPHEVDSSSIRDNATFKCGGVDVVL